MREGLTSIFIENLDERIVSSEKEALAVLEEGQEHRHIRATQMNETSSRAHTLFRLSLMAECHPIENSAAETPSAQPSDSSVSPSPSTQPSSTQTNAQNERPSYPLKKLCAQLYLVDLAGSERASQAQTEGKGAHEASFINRSLLTLGRVIYQLSSNSAAFIPYRDSKLTFILKENLSGNSNTAVVCTINPSTRFFETTKNSLTFADSASRVRTCPHVNEVLDDKTRIFRLEQENRNLREDNRSLRARVAALEGLLPGGSSLSPSASPSSLGTRTHRSSTGLTRSRGSIGLSFDSTETLRKHNSIARIGKGTEEEEGHSHTGNSNNNQNSNPNQENNGNMEWSNKKELEEALDTQRRLAEEYKTELDTLQQFNTELLQENSKYGWELQMEHDRLHSLQSELSSEKAAHAEAQRRAEEAEQKLNSATVEYEKTKEQLAKLKDSHADSNQKVCNSSFMMGFFYYSIFYYHILYYTLCCIHFVYFIPFSNFLSLFSSVVIPHSVALIPTAHTKMSS